MIIKYWGKEKKRGSTDIKKLENSDKVVVSWVWGLKTHLCVQRKKPKTESMQEQTMH